jgi:hypothetical protein
LIAAVSIGRTVRPIENWPTYFLKQIDGNGFSIFYPTMG